MTAALTLSLYIVRQFALSVSAMLLALSGLVAMFDFIELLRRSANHPEVSFGTVGQIAALRLPYVAMQILPFAVLLGGILCFWRLTRSSELIVARAAGISAWEFLTAPTFCALLFGVIATALVSPVSSVMLGAAEKMDDAYLRTGGGPLALNGGQLWLRQSDRQMSPQGVAIIHAQQVEVHGKQLAAQRVSVFRLDGSDKLLSRIEATKATLGNGNWVLDDARAIRPDQLPDAPHAISLPTDLTVNRVQESFASPDTLSFWALPGFIALLDRSRVFFDPPPTAFPGIAGPAVAVRDNDAGVRRVLHAAGPPRRRGEDDRQRRRRRIRSVRGVESRRRDRSVRCPSGRIGCLGAGRIRPYARRRAAATHRRWIAYDRTGRAWATSTAR